MMDENSEDEELSVIDPPLEILLDEDAKINCFPAKTVTTPLDPIVIFDSEIVTVLLTSNFPSIVEFVLEAPEILSG